MRFRVALLLLLAACGASPARPATGYLVYVRDREGSVLAAVDDQGKVLSSASDDAFGLRLSSTGTPVPRAFLDKELDEETGYYHFHARYYDPATAQWISPDPKLLANPDCSGRVQDCNPYTFAGNRPLEWTDEDGRETFSFVDRNGVPTVVYTAGIYGIHAVEAQARIVRGTQQMQGQVRVVALLATYQTAAEVPAGAHRIDATGDFVRRDCADGSAIDSDGEIHLGAQALEQGRSDLQVALEVWHELWHGAGHAAEGYVLKNREPFSLSAHVGGVGGNYLADGSKGFNANEAGEWFHLDAPDVVNQGKTHSDPSLFESSTLATVVGGAGLPSAASNGLSALNALSN